VREYEHVCPSREALFGQAKRILRGLCELDKRQPVLNLSRDGWAVHQQARMPHGLERKVEEKAVLFAHAAQVDARTSVIITPPLRTARIVFASALTPWRKSWFMGAEPVITVWVFIIQPGNTRPTDNFIWLHSPVNA